MISERQVRALIKMKIENQVCSLELAKKLKELGVEQDSYFFWYGGKALRQNQLTQELPVSYTHLTLPTKRIV